MKKGWIILGTLHLLLAVWLMIVLALGEMWIAHYFSMQLSDALLRIFFVAVVLATGRTAIHFVEKPMHFLIWTILFSITALSLMVPFVSQRVYGMNPIVFLLLAGSDFIVVWLSRKKIK